MQLQKEAKSTPKQISCKKKCAALKEGCCEKMFEIQNGSQ